MPYIFGKDLLLKGVEGIMQNKEGLRLMAVKDFDQGEELYNVVDFLNKSLKDKNLIFGIRKSGDKHTITIYET